MNTKVGKDTNIYKIGIHSLHDISNNNGQRLVDFALSKNMVISSVKFPHKNIHKETWISPDGNTKNQIDHVLIDSRHASDIIDVRSYRGADCDSDHYLVRIKYRPKLSTINRDVRTRNNKHNIEKLKHVIILQEYKATIQQKLENQPLTDVDSIEESWNNIKNIIHNSAEEILGYIQPRKRNNWFDEECREALQVRNDKRMKMLQRCTRANTMEYTKARKDAKTVIRRKKKAFQEHQLQELQEKFNRNESRKFFESIRKIKNDFQPRTIMC